VILSIHHHNRLNVYMLLNMTSLCNAMKSAARVASRQAREAAIAHGRLLKSQLQTDAYRS